MISALRSSAAAALLSLACSGPGDAAPPANPGGLRAITLEDSAAIREPGEPRMSPDRRWVAYTVEGQVMVAAVSGGAVHAVTSAGSHTSDPRWSRDGRALYFLSDRAAGTRQLWRLPIADFGEAEQISQLPRGLDSVNLSPDESRLLLAFAGPAAPTAGESDGRRKSPWVITRRQFKEDAGDGYITGDAGTHLYVLDLRTQAPPPPDRASRRGRRSTVVADQPVRRRDGVRRGLDGGAGRALQHVRPAGRRELHLGEEPGHAADGDCDQARRDHHAVQATSRE